MERRMNANLVRPVTSEATDARVAAGATWAHRDHAALPAKTLGPKASLLHARRQRCAPEPRIATTDVNAALRLTTSDAAVSFVLKPSGSALYVERIQRRPLGAHIVQCMVFCSADEFSRWCDAEPLRFDDPGLHRRLTRRGQEFFGEAR